MKSVSAQLLQQLFQKKKTKKKSDVMTNNKACATNLKLNVNGFGDDHLNGCGDDLNGLYLPEGSNHDKMVFRKKKIVKFLKSSESCSQRAYIHFY